MVLTSGANPERRRPLSGRLRRLGAVCAVAAAIALPASTLAVVQLFADVPPSSPYFANVQNLALSGVTAGCGGDNYCPTSPVTREQMAAFLNRGLGRVAYGTWHTSVPTTETPAWHTFSITTGMPGGALSGATQFVKADADLSIVLDDATGCPCTFRGALYMTGVGYLQAFFTDITLTTVGEIKVMAMTGVHGVTTTGAQTIEVRVFRYSGGGSASAYGQATAEVFPFGSTGGNILSPSAASAPGGSATATEP